MQTTYKTCFLDDLRAYALHFLLGSLASSFTICMFRVNPPQIPI